MLQDHAEHCNCPGGREPGGRARISSTGCCPRCGVQGSRRAQAIRDALASQNWRPAIEQARGDGYAAGHAAGLIEGRRQVIDALAAGDWLSHVTAANAARYRARLAAMPAPRPVHRGGVAA